ncbi:outer membrane beta-barrel protein [Methylobacterium sp. WL7]|uniref:outer membrane protein n=1 Tax=Methylobacterium sp. WL7 TaxID=2603900 RepID=UPI0011CC85E6|nr:outer membrane beta-barrel protein [Methylobacterium sp. WL7]TXN44939.1 porin family protein [Methylobacterium sp. WL7]
MFYKTFAPVSALVALTTVASAADLPRRAYTPPPPALPAFTWAGPYFGINAGYITSTKDAVTTVGVLPFNNGVVTGDRPGTRSLPRDGFVGGGQLGYNVQLTPGSGFVVGAEADLAYTDQNRTRSSTGRLGGISTFRQMGNALGTLRGRVGYAFDRTLVYGTGGFAYAGETYRGVFQTASGRPSFYGSSSRVETGYAVGGGIEFALPTDSAFNIFHTNAVTLRGEALYYDLGRRTVPLVAVGPGVGAYAARFRNEGVLGRFGLNYKFGS